jgi:hypothetical protein
MKTQAGHHLESLISVPGIFLACLALLVSAHRVGAQGTAFTYSGNLDNTGIPASGVFDFTFSLSTSSNEFAQIGATITNAAVPVTNGTFAVTLDFGSGIFTGSLLWVEIAVRTNGATNFSILNGLQPISPVPYAIMANTASNLLGTLPTSQLTGLVSTAQLSGSVVTNNGTNVSLNGTFNGNSAGLTNYQATNLVYSVSTNAPMVANGTNFSLDFNYNKVIWILTTNACISNTLHAASGDNHMEVWIRTTNQTTPFVISWLPNVNLVGACTTNGLKLTNSAGFWVMAVSQYGTNWQTNTCTYAIIPPNR